jgi:hypothetical protein
MLVGAGVMGGGSGFRKQLTVNHSLIPGDLTNFPVLLSIETDADLAAKCKSASDIRITDANKNLLDYEIERFDRHTGELILWFKAPALSSAVDTNFYLCYGNPSAASENAAGVWDANYMAVHHLAQTWKPYASNPVLTVTGAETLATWGSVVIIGSVWHMYFSYNPGGTGTKNVIGHATSSDGKTWTRDDDNNPILDVSVGKFDSDNCWLPRVFLEGATYYMLYSGSGSGAGTCIGLATSPDGITWTKANDGDPIFTGTTAEWDATDTEISSIIKVGETYYLWYNTISASPRQSGVATATSLLGPWTKDVNNPIFTGADLGRFCGDIWKYGDTYYYCTPHYTSGTDYAEFELYQDVAPTFYSESRVPLGVIKRSPQTNGWDRLDADTPWLVTDDVYRNTFSGTGGMFYLYMAAQANGPGAWSMGLLVANPTNALNAMGKDSTDNHNLVFPASTNEKILPPFMAAQIGGGREFVATWSNYISMTKHADLNPVTNGGFVWEVWLKPYSVTGQHEILEYRNAASSSQIITLVTTTTSLFAQVRGVDTVNVTGTADTALEIGGWYKAGISRELDGKVYIWLNGVKKLLGTTTSAVAPDQDFFIGTAVDGGHAVPGNLFFAGILDEIRISNSPRSDAWLQAGYNNESSPGTFIAVGTQQSG